LASRGCVLRVVTELVFRTALPEQIPASIEFLLDPCEPRAARRRRCFAQAAFFLDQVVHALEDGSFVHAALLV
jgi:hypothetical protein